MFQGITRRRALMGVGGLFLAGPVGALERLLPTPSATTGPFYPEQPPADDDSDLTRVMGRTGTARGEHTELTGRLLDRNGNAIAGGRIEIWQCDANGRYHHPRDTRSVPDPNFQGFGHAVTDGEGRYRFRTIKPVPYPGRTPHIHMAVWAAERRVFVTQLYVRGEPRNADDFLFRRIPAEQRERATAAFRPGGRDGLAYRVEFDVVLDVTPASA